MKTPSLMPTLAATPLLIGLTGSACTNPQDAELTETLENLRWAAHDNGGEPPYAEEGWEVRADFDCEEGNDGETSGECEVTLQVRGQSDQILNPEEEFMQGSDETVEDYLWGVDELVALNWEQGANHTVARATDLDVFNTADAPNFTMVLGSDDFTVVVGFQATDEDVQFGAEFVEDGEDFSLVE